MSPRVATTGRPPPARGRSVPAVLVAAGLDPSGGSGIAADVEALLGVGARALPVATALTVQGPSRALRFEPVRPAFVIEQIDGVLLGARPAALKTGMIGSAATAGVLAQAFARPSLRALPLVVDPVLAASAGLPLLRGTRGRSARDVLWPLLARASLSTPNWLELEALAGARLRTDDEAIAAARALPSAAVLVKGGHRRGAPVDLLVTPTDVYRFEGRRRPGTARGTGCRLASAVAGLLARGATLVDAVAGARRLVEAYLDASIFGRVTPRAASRRRRCWS